MHLEVTVTDPPQGMIRQVEVTIPKCCIVQHILPCIFIEDTVLILGLLARDSLSASCPNGYLPVSFALTIANFGPTHTGPLSVLNILFCPPPSTQFIVP
jgi:hypothetical protein